MPVTRPVRVVTGCNNSMPVRVVTEGGDPVRIVTEGISDPVRIVTGGASTPIVVISGGVAPDAPTFVSGEVGTVDSSTVVVTFSTDITAPCGDCGLGFTVLVNAAPDAITACVIVGGNTVRLTLTTAVAWGDTVTVSYDSTVGCIMESTGVTDLVTFPAQAVTNNVAAPWYRAGGAPAPIIVYQPKDAASLAASYSNLINPGTYDAAPGTAPTWDAVNGWKFLGTSSQYLTTGYTLGVSRVFSVLVRATNLVIIGGGDYALVGALGPAASYPRIALDNYNSGGAGKFGYGMGGYLNTTPGYVSGVYGVTAGSAYYNGGNVGIVPAVAGAIPELYIGARHWSTGAIDSYLTGYIQDIVMYPAVLSDAQFLAVSTEMAAL